MISRTLFVVFVLLALTHVLAVSMDSETTQARRAHHKAHHRAHLKVHAAKHRATVKNQLKTKTHEELALYLKHHTAVSSLSLNHLVAMDHAVSLMHRTFTQMKSAMKNLRSHINAKLKHGNKAGYVYADVVDSLDNYAPLTASLPYYLVTCSNCMQYVHQCLNCVYDKPQYVPTIVPEYLSTSYLPEYPVFPVEPVQQDQEIDITQSLQPRQETEQEEEEDEEQERQHSVAPTGSHVNTLLNALNSGLPTLEQGLYTIQTDIQKIQSHLPGGIPSSSDSWPNPGDTPLSDQGTLNNIADHSDVGTNGPHLNHILTVVKSIQGSLPEYQKDLKQLQLDLSRCGHHQPDLMSEPTTTDYVE